MGNAFGVKELLKREPWRAGQGQPRSAIDPLWEGHRPQPCDGEAEFEKDSKWWWCKKCGHCSCWPITRHYRVEHPSDYHRRSLAYFTRVRARQGMSPAQIKEQVLHITGVALRVAATQTPDELGRYIDRCVQLPE